MSNQSNPCLGLVLTSELATLVLRAPIVAGTLNVYKVSCAELTPSVLHKVLLHFAPTALNITGCQLRACQLTDELIRALIKNQARRIEFQNTPPVDGGNFRVTDDAIVDFCLQQDAQTAREGVAATEWSLGGELVVCNGRFTKDLFKRLVQASSVSMRTQSLRIFVAPSPVEDEELRDFAQHLSYRNRGSLWQIRIYDFPGEQQGATTVMHLQIALHPGNRLEQIRARRPHVYFNKPDA